MFVQVAVPVPTLDLLTYCVPDGVEPPAVGARVVVPLGSRWVTGIVVERGATAPADCAAIKPIRQALDQTSFVPADVVSLARWTAEYYAGGVGEAITAVLPPKTRGDRVDAHKSRRVVTVTAAGIEALACSEGVSTATKKQREVIAIVGGVPDGAATADLAARGFSADMVGRLLRDGLLLAHRQQVDRVGRARYAGVPQ